MTKKEFSPNAKLLQDVREFVAEQLPGTPTWALFPRWYTAKPVILVESISRTHLAKVDLNANTVTMFNGNILRTPTEWRLP